jgi:hypothetical protein
MRLTADAKERLFENSATHTEDKAHTLTLD